jgi:hypothetical protein
MQAGTAITVPRVDQRTLFEERLAENEITLLAGLVE